MPEPTTAKLVDKKTAAYEKQQAEVEEESRMKSLEQLAGTLMNNGKSSDTGEKEKDGDRLQQSVNTYEQISGQLDDFYETPKETASGDLERKVDELNKKLEEAEKEKSKAATREELMERSYRMAAKYLNPDKDTVREKAVGEEPTEVVPVQRAEYQTTSGLSRPVTDSAFIASLTVERNYGFNTAVGSSYQMGTNTIAACISENQTIEQGGRVRLRLLQPLQAGSITVPENSLVTGAAVIQGERLDILISSIEYAGNIIPVQLATYDIDGQKGIFVPGSETRNAAKDAAGTVSESMGNSVSFARSAGQQVVMDLTRGVMQGGTRLIAGRVRAVKVTLKAGYKVLLVTKKQERIIHFNKKDKTMKIVIALLMAVLASVSGFAQEERPANPVRILTAGQHITPYKIEVTFGKTVHILFPTEVRYVDLGSNNIIAGKADGVENVVRVKAAVKEFPGETNFSVITGDGSFFSFNVVYKEEPSTLNINMDQWMNPDEGEKKGGSSIRVTELGEEDPTVIASVMYTIHRLDRRDVKHIGCRQFGMQALLKGIYVHKDLIFFHVSLTNNSNVPFDVDFVRFKIVDKKIAKRTARQETYIEPVRTLNALTRIVGKSTGRIVYAFPKIVIPDDKLLEVEIYEKGGGRHQRFYMENSDLVDARIVNELIGE